jgi:hypothetical protein
MFTIPTMIPLVESTNEPLHRMPKLDASTVPLAYTVLLPGVPYPKDLRPRKIGWVENRPFHAALYFQTVTQGTIGREDTLLVYWRSPQWDTAECPERYFVMRFHDFRDLLKTSWLEPGGRVSGHWVFEQKGGYLAIKQSPAPAVKNTTVMG